MSDPLAIVPIPCSEPVVPSVTVFPLVVVTGAGSTGCGVDRGVVATRRGFLLGVRISDGFCRCEILGAVAAGLGAGEIVTGTSFSCGCAIVSALASWRS